MQLELEKSQLQEVLLTISAYNSETKELVGGLLSEDLTLGAKRKLQKIHKSVLSLYTEFTEDVKTLQKECGDDKEKLQKEFNELLKETIKLEIEPVSLAQIDNLYSKNRYNFDIIEKIAL
jgi:hypothetical protein